MALEPGGLKDQLVTAAADGEMKMTDFRMLGDASAAASAPGSGAGSLGVWKTVNASATSRNLSALAAHPHSPLLATGTATQARGPHLTNILYAFLELILVLLSNYLYTDTRLTDPLVQLDLS